MIHSRYADRTIRAVTVVGVAVVVACWLCDAAVESW
eukprot:SAG31_NODE_38221_length_298_cov_0.663317_1_plen_35_part_01